MITRFLANFIIWFTILSIFWGSGIFSFLFIRYGIANWSGSFSLSYILTFSTPVDCVLIGIGFGLFALLLVFYIYFRLEKIRITCALIHSSSVYYMDNLSISLVPFVNIFFMITLFFFTMYTLSLIYTSEQLDEAFSISPLPQFQVSNMGITLMSLLVVFLYWTFCSGNMLARFAIVTSATSWFYEPEGISLM